MKTYLISVTSLTDGMGQFLQDRALTWTHEDVASDPERVVEAAGRVCYMSFGARQHRQSTGDYLSHIIAQGHDSVLEHANFTVLVDGLTRALSHQLVRHRIGFAYSQLSQQYHDESDAEFIEPPWLDDDPALREQWSRWNDATHAMYETLLKSGADTDLSQTLNPRELQRFVRSMARSVLPNATPTTLVVTGNARAWRNLLRSRGDTAGDLEMRNYCVSVYRLLYAAAPNLFAGFDLVEDPWGCSLRTKTS
jgi:thymidylate synthase (FAD)